MKILFYKWKVFNQEDIKDALEELGHYVTFYEEPEAVQKGRERRELTEAVAEYDAVFSVNYFSRVSEACNEKGKKYIAWTVDSPMISMYNTSVFNACNYVFVFDKFDYCQFKAMGAKTVYYMPLAVNTARLDKLIAADSEEQLKKYDSDISFVGGLYYKNSYDNIKDKLTDYLRGYLDSAMWAQMDIFGENIFDRMLTTDILSQLLEIVEFKQDKEAFSDFRLVFTNTYLGFKLAQTERIYCLNRLAKNFNVDLYCDSDSEELIGVNRKGTVSYACGMPKVFNRSKINMNFTIRNIRSGLPLRAWDVLGAGGFLLTNFQAEIPEYFENGRDLVYYEDLNDMERKAEYYLNHEEERLDIARRGHDKVKQFHSYRDRLEKMFAIVCGG